ncbi:sigma-54-dependent transcriptional regulator [Paracoccus aminovorans]|uniref:sigma-54-dependent transcriptional regulator n=1 Tax=Paracoccus aminovorans TaxID=34004 RepID=UPI000781B60D|nr:sigma-54 dependent transcriptional regulator [Paracoccus aminovorans]MDQ7777771.1 sigma-54 dependent transcriptional regulator [Paracoccus aminovorans]
MQAETDPRPDTQGAFGAAIAQAAILVVEDEPGMRNFLERILAPKCRAIRLAANTAEASALIAETDFDLVILDNLMEGQRGVDWLSEQRRLGFFPPAILMTAFADMETAIQALQAGASDFLLKPFRTNQLLNSITRCLEGERLRRENLVLRQELRNSLDQDRLRSELIGSSPAIEAVRQVIARVAATPSSVLITGASGTGKEVAARMIHALSDRADHAFVPVNCAAIPQDMLETELFGHIRGAFPGAQQNREGLFMSARGGTLFLDEIAELSVGLQAKLLRAIEDRRIRPLGSERETPVDVRLIFAANTDLDKAVAEGRLRADLLYRINVLHIAMPTLVERGPDLFDLVHLFMAILSRQLGMRPVPITAEVRANLATYDWPGNVRELRNAVERALILGRFPPLAAPLGRRDGQTLAEIERRAIMGTLAALDGDREAAAARLGISRKTIDRRLADWNG